MNTRYLFIVSLIFIGGCKDQSIAPSASPQQIFPLAIGNQWVMQMYYDTIAVSGAGDIDTGTVVAMAPHDGNTMYCFSGNDHFFFESWGTTEFLFYKGNDLWQSRNGMDNLLIAANCSVGDSTFRSDSQRVAKIMSLNDTVTVPAGTFVCKKIAYDSFDSYLIRYYWLVSGVGVVKIEYGPIYLQHNPISWRLKSYKLY